MIYSFWIVNESGEDIQVVDGIGSDGCIYEIDPSDDTAVVRITHDGMGLYYSGEFDLHHTKFGG